MVESAAMRELQVVDDQMAIDLLAERCAKRLRIDVGSRHHKCRLVAIEVSQFSSITAHQVEQWHARGHIAAHKRLAFLQAFNALRGPKLPMVWLAAPAQRQNGGQHGEGEAQERKAQGKRHRSQRRTRRRTGRGLRTLAAENRAG
jgi:hypothetical protein